MNGILIDAESGDLLIERGSVVIGETDSQIAGCVLVAMRGEWKEWPLIGGEVKKMLGGEACGLDVRKVNITEGGIITVE